MKQQAQGLRLLQRRQGYQINIEDSSSGNISEILTSNTAMGFFADRANSVASTSMIFSVDNTTALTIDQSQNSTFAGNVIGSSFYVAGGAGAKGIMILQLRVLVQVLLICFVRQDSL